MINPKASLFDELVPQNSSGTGFSFRSEEDKKVCRAVIKQLATDLSKGDFSGLLTMFNAKNKEAEAMFQSWVNSGKIAGIGPDEVQKILDEKHLNQLAEYAKVDRENAEKSLVRVLPQVVHHLAPIGEIPSERALRNNVRLLQDQLDV